ncbi:MAG: response regulator [Verrucomicrobiota bacterium]|jgi:PAS domain S-box-containing protein
MSDAAVRVLLVDDDEDDYIITRDLVSKIGDSPYRLEWVDNYDAALVALQRREHDVCLLDYRLGERTGLELLRESQSFSGRPPMILLTGQGGHEIDLEATKAGAADYLLKGQLDADKLERAIRYAIEGQRAKEHLRRDRDLISRIMETSPVGIVVTDQAGKITFANHRAEEVLSLTKDAIAQKTCSVLDWHPTDLEGNALAKQPSPLKQVLDSGQAAQDICHAINHPNGRHTLLSTNATPLFDAANKIDGMVVTVEDITERLMLEAQLRQSQKMQSVGQLAAGVAHDINNILTVIQGHAGLLLNITPPGADSFRSLKQISAASERAASFVRQLLTFSRKQIFRSKILDLNTVLKNLENMLPQMLGEDIALETRYQPNLPHIEADTGMIEQIVMNLAVNSRDAMPKGGKLLIATSAIEIGTAYMRQHPEAQPGWFVCLTVTDTGCGMDHKVLQRLFEPFFTTKEVGKGTGLGLATIYGMVKQHQGWIEVQSEIGVGSTFKVFLPVAGETRNAPAAPTVEPKPAQGGEETILVVEDETGLLELVRNVLQGYHYRVLAASSGVEALQIWDEHNGRIDLLLTDMIMPGGMTGNDLAAKLRKQKPGLKVIYTSGYSSELTGRDSGANNTTFLAKPYLPLQLAQAVRKCLDASPESQHEHAPIPADAVPAPAQALSTQPA